MNYPRILIIRPDRLGDVVLSTGIPREIKKHFPDAFIAMLLREYAKDIYVNNPFVDEIITMEQQKSSIIQNFKNILTLRKYAFTHSIMLLPTEKMNWIAFFAGIKMRIGVGHKFYQFITNAKSIYRRKYKELRSEADYCMDAVRKLGIQTNDFTPAIYLSNDEKTASKEFRHSLKASQKILIGIHATSGNSAPNMPVEEYFLLIEELQKIDTVCVVNTDVDPPDQIRKTGIPLINESKPLRESIIRIASLDLFISASTGPMHIAGALKVPTISVFCPMTACSPVLWRPQGNRSNNLLPDSKYCQTKCPGDPKKCNLQGEGGINHKKVLNAVKNFL